MRLDRRLIQLAKSAKIALGVAILAGFAAGILAVIQARLLSRAVQRAFLDGQGLQQLQDLLLWLAAAALARALMVWILDAAGNAASGKIRHELRVKLYSHLLRLGPGYAREEQSGEMVNTAVEGVETLDAYFSQYLPQVVLAAIVPLGMVLLIFPIDPLSALILLVTAPLIPVFMVLIGEASDALAKKQWLSLSRMSAYFLDVIQGLKTLKTLGRSREQADRIDTVSEQFRYATMRVLRVSFLSALALEMLATISTALVAVEVGLRLLYGRMAFEQALFVLILAPEFYQPLRTLGARFHAAVNGAAAADRLFAILNTQPEQPAAKSLPLPPSTSIRFEHVNFRYPDGRTGLEDASFEIAAGMITALAGPSGAGKTTAGEMVLRFHEPQTGSIRVVDQLLGEIPHGQWREQIAWVPQEPYLFDGSLAENIRLGKPDAGMSEVTAAAEMAHLHGFIASLPEGYQTQIGERGARLSGGQKRLVALARAFLKDAPILVLDEPTASLNLQTEALIEDSLRRLTADRTVLVIAHRPGTLQGADQVIWLEDGRVAHIQTADRRPQTAERIQTGDRRQQTAAPTLTADRRPRTASIPSSHSRVDQPSSFSRLLRLIGFLRPYAELVALSVLLGFATTASGVGLMASSAYIISMAALQPSIAVIQVAIVGVRFFGISRGVFRYLERYVTHQVTFKLLGTLRGWLYRGLEPLAPARITLHSGDISARLLGDISALENFYVRSVAPPLSAALMTAAACWFMAQFDPRLAWILLASLVSTGVGIPLLAHLLARQPGRDALRARALLSTALVDGIQGMGDLLVFGRAQAQEQRVAAVSGEWIRAQRRLAWIGGLEDALVLLFSHLGMLALLAAAIPLAQFGRFEPVYLAVIALAGLASFEAAAPLPAAARTLSASLAAAGRLFEVVDSTPEVRDTGKRAELPPGAEIELKEVRFCYPGSIEPALDGVSLRIPAGKRVAVVGPVGSGKSTLINLLMRFWEYTDGEICLGGVDLRNLPQEDTRSRLAVSPQDAYLFNASLRDNLRLGKPGASEEEIRAAASTAQLEGLVEKLPEGYDTWIGEQGQKLSAGERQRVSAASALVSDAPVLVFDEPTAHLDPETERRFVEAVLSGNEGRSVLWISHRMVGMEHMDEILVLEQGRVVERGTHAQLLARNGRYAALWKMENPPGKLVVDK